MLSVTQLHMLQQVLETGSFAEAGKRLGFTASAVSQQIASLERSTGIALFERGPRSIRPTPAARALESPVINALMHIDLLERELRDMATGERGAIRIGTFPTAGASLVPPALARLKRSHPGLDVRLDYGEPVDLIPRLEAGTTDLIIAYEYDLVPQLWSKEFDRIPLLYESVILLVDRAHAAAHRKSISVAELADESWITPLHDAAITRSLERLCASAGFAPRVAYRSNDYDVVRGLVGAGLGVAILPALAHVDSSLTRAVGLEVERAGRQVFTLQRPRVHTPLLKSVTQALRGAARARARSDHWTTLATQPA